MIVVCGTTLLISIELIPGKLIAAESLKSSQSAGTWDDSVGQASDSQFQGWGLEHCVRLCAQ